jgi:hypothetical protein
MKLTSTIPIYVLLYGPEFNTVTFRTVLLSIVTLHGRVNLNLSVFARVSLKCVNFDKRTVT